MFLKLFALAVVLGLCSAGNSRRPIDLPVRSKSHQETIHTPSHREEQNTHINVPGDTQPVYLTFKTFSSPLYVKQEHSGTKGSHQKTHSKDGPHILEHEVIKPVLQELKEVINPYRKVTQIITPVQEKVLTKVHKGESGHDDKDHKDNGDKDNNGGNEGYGKVNGHSDGVNGVKRIGNLRNEGNDKNSKVLNIVSMKSSQGDKGALSGMFELIGQESGPNNGKDNGYKVIDDKYKREEYSYKKPTADVYKAFDFKTSYQNTNRGSDAGSRSGGDGNGKGFDSLTFINHGHGDHESNEKSIGGLGYDDREGIGGNDGFDKIISGFRATERNSELGTDSYKKGNRGTDGVDRSGKGGSDWHEKSKESSNSGRSGRRDHEWYDKSKEDLGNDRNGKTSTEWFEKNKEVSGVDRNGKVGNDWYENSKESLGTDRKEGNEWFEKSKEGSGVDRNGKVGKDWYESSKESLGTDRKEGYEWSEKSKESSNAGRSGKGDIEGRDWYEKHIGGLGRNDEGSDWNGKSSRGSSSADRSGNVENKSHGKSKEGLGHERSGMGGNDGNVKIQVRTSVYADQSESTGASGSGMGGMNNWKLMNKEVISSDRSGKRGNDWYEKSKESLVTDRRGKGDSDENIKSIRVSAHPERSSENSGKGVMSNWKVIGKEDSDINDRESGNGGHYGKNQRGMSGSGSGLSDIIRSQSSGHHRSTEGSEGKGRDESGSDWFTKNNNNKGFVGLVVADREPESYLKGNKDLVESQSKTTLDLGTLFEMNGRGVDKSTSRESPFGSTDDDKQEDYLYKRYQQEMIKTLNSGDGYQDSNGETEGYKQSSFGSGSGEERSRDEGRTVGYAKNSAVLGEGHRSGDSGNERYGKDSGRSGGGSRGVDADNNGYQKYYGGVGGSGEGIGEMKGLVSAGEGELKDYYKLLRNEENGRKDMRFGVIDDDYKREDYSHKNIFKPTAEMIKAFDVSTGYKIGGSDGFGKISEEMGGFVKNNEGNDGYTKYTSALDLPVPNRGENERYQKTYRGLSGVDLSANKDTDGYRSGSIGSEKTGNDWLQKNNKFAENSQRKSDSGRDLGGFYELLGQESAQRAGRESRFSSGDDQYHKDDHLSQRHSPEVNKAFNLLKSMLKI